jgi:uncharacterized protein YuzB (UPF0349 family)
MKSGLDPLDIYFFHHDLKGGRHMGIIVVEICDGSLITSINLEEILESKYPEVSVLENTCLSFCGMCAKRPYAIVNGKRIFAKTVEECLEKIEEHIENELAIYA